MEEEWMRDRALLRDLLEKTPQASPQELARETGRSVSWVKKWRKRFAEGDPSDLSWLCSRSRAHHTPYFRWDSRVIQRIVEMRLAPPENADRAYLDLVLCSSIFRVISSCKRHRSPCPAPVARNGAILHATGFLQPHSEHLPRPTELRQPLEEIQMDAR